MKKFILREDEINYIKNLYGLNEQTNTANTQTNTPTTQTNTPTTQTNTDNTQRNTPTTQTKNYTIKELQDLVISKGVQIVSDNKYGPKTANAIITILNKPERTTPQQETTPPVVAPQQITPKPAAQIPTNVPERQLQT